VEYEYISKDEGRHKLECKLKKEIDSWHWYDQMMFNYYRDNEWSMREASKNTGIGTASVFRTIKYCKERLRENCAEDYEDFMNEDYEKI
jgi:DNA-directed RNA polymerase specialized sigma subunit